LRAILFLFIAAVREGDSGSSFPILLRLIAVFGEDDSDSSCAVAMESPSSLASAIIEVSVVSAVLDRRDLRGACAAGASDVVRRRDALFGATGFFGTGVYSSSASSSSSSSS
jgi:hypothetical protein